MSLYNGRCKPCVLIGLEDGPPFPDIIGGGEGRGWGWGGEEKVPRRQSLSVYFSKEIIAPELTCILYTLHHEAEFFHHGSVTFARTLLRSYNSVQVSSTLSNSSFFYSSSRYGHYAEGTGSVLKMADIDVRFELAV